MCFRIDKETFGVAILAVREIVRVQEVTRVPGSPDFVLGVINLRGRIISVIDLGLRLGLGPRSVDRNSRILVIHLGRVTVGFLVDAATEVIKLPEEAIEPPPEITGAVGADFIDAVGKCEDRLVIILNLDRVGSYDEVLEADASAGTQAR